MNNNPIARRNNLKLGSFCTNGQTNASQTILGADGQDRRYVPIEKRLKRKSSPAGNIRPAPVISVSTDIPRELIA